jgi:hypothetical protein
MGLFQFLWRLLPDRCQMPGCTRHGVRGNENILPINGKWRLVCDECTTIHLMRQKAREDYHDLQDEVTNAMNRDQP